MPSRDIVFLKTLERLTDDFSTISEWREYGRYSEADDVLDISWLRNKLDAEVEDEDWAQILPY